MLCVRVNLMTPLFSKIIKLLSNINSLKNQNSKIFIFPVLYKGFIVNVKQMK